MTPEVTVLREVLAARAAERLADAENERRRAEEDRLVEQIVGALESSGVPLAIKPEDTICRTSPRDEDGEAAG